MRLYPDEAVFNLALTPAQLDRFNARGGLSYVYRVPGMKTVILAYPVAVRNGPTREYILSTFGLMQGLTEVFEDFLVRELHIKPEKSPSRRIVRIQILPQVAAGQRVMHRGPQEEQRHRHDRVAHARGRSIGAGLRERRRPRPGAPCRRDMTPRNRPRTALCAKRSLNTPASVGPRPMPTRPSTRFTTNADEARMLAPTMFMPTASVGVQNTNSVT